MTIAKLSLEPQRDVVFKFQDSCNCCCWSWKRKRSKTPLYINSKGEAVKFDFKKAHDRQEALEKSLNNLRQNLIQMCAQNERDKEVLMKELHEKIDELDSKNHQYITRNTLENINELLDRLT